MFIMIIKNIYKILSFVNNGLLALVGRARAIRQFWASPIIIRNAPSTERKQGRFVRSLLYSALIFFAIVLLRCIPFPHRETLAVESTGKIRRFGKPLPEVDVLRCPDLSRRSDACLSARSDQNGIVVFPEQTDWHAFIWFGDRYIGSEYEFTILTETGPARLVWQTNWRGAHRFECDFDGPVYGGITVNLGELFRRGYVAPESIIAQLRKHNCMQVR
jgi:hypothetical protein